LTLERGECCVRTVFEVTSMHTQHMSGYAVICLTCSMDRCRWLYIVVWSCAVFEVAMPLEEHLA